MYRLNSSWFVSHKKPVEKFFRPALGGSRPAGSRTSRVFCYFIILALVLHREKGGAMIDHSMDRGAPALHFGILDHGNR